MYRGYVKLHRKITEWEWYSDHNVTRIFIHLLMKANHKNSRYQGHDIHAGTAVVGRKQFAAEIGLSEQQVRTALLKLKNSQEITIRSTNKFSMIHIVKWAYFQSEQPANQPTDNQQVTNNQPTSNQQVTNNQPTDNQQVTTSKECKNEKNEKNDKNDKNEKKETPRATALDFSSWPSLPDKQVMKDWLSMRKRLKANVTQTVVNRLGTKLVAAKQRGLSVDDCLGECIERNWKGFDVSWMSNKNNQNQKLSPAQQAIQNRRERIKL